MEENNKIITTSEWIITKLIMFIPILIYYANYLA